MFNLYFVS